MKKAALSFLVLFMTTQANADQVLLCSDTRTGVDAGKLIVLPTEPDSPDKTTILYSKTRISNDGWELTLTQDGKLYNADLMVQGGKEYFVGTVTFDSLKWFVNIEGSELVCE